MTAMPALDRRSDYVAAVAVELADLAPDDRAELIEELDDHVAALLEDRPGVDVVAELGTPRAYAAELRAAAGLTGSAPPRPSLRDIGRLAVTRVETAVPWLRPFAHFVRPAWWVLRGAAIALAIADFFGFPFPSGVTWVLIAAGVLGSLWLAQRPHPSRRFRLGVMTVDAVGVIATLWAAAFLAGVAASSYQNVQYATQYVPNCPIELSNLYAYDAQGKPIEGVRLYDQNGNPFDLSVFGCSGGQFAPNGEPNIYPYPSAPVVQDGAAPTGPPASLAPLPGATVPASGGATPTPTGTP